MIVPFHSSFSVPAATSPATHIALSAAAMGLRTALIDLDYGGGFATHRLGRAHAEPRRQTGYEDVLMGRARVLDAIRPTGAANCYVLSAAALSIGRKLVDEERADRIDAIELYAQLEECASYFDLTVVALPDRFPPEAVHVLERSPCFVTVFEPTMYGLRAANWYSDWGGSESLLQLSSLLAAIPFGRYIHIDLIEAFSAQYGSALVPFFQEEPHHDLAVLDAKTLAEVEPSASSTRAVGHITALILDRLALRTGKSLVSGGLNSWLDRGDLAPREDEPRADYFNAVNSELAKLRGLIQPL